MRSSENRELRTEKDKKGLRQINAADRRTGVGKCEYMSGQ